MRSAGRSLSLNELATEAGRDPKAIEILVYIAPADRAKLQALENAGADAAVMLLASQPEEALAELEQIAQQVL